MKNYYTYTYIKDGVEDLELNKNLHYLIYLELLRVESLLRSTHSTTVAVSWYDPYYTHGNV